MAALVEQRRGPRGPHPNRVSDAVEAKILAYALEHPTHGAQRVANELRLQNVNVGVSGVRGCGVVAMTWSRVSGARSVSNATSRRRRSSFRKNSSACLNATASSSVAGTSSRRGPGELLNQDTFFWGTLKGVGKVYVQVVVVDVFCSLAFAKVYTSKATATIAA